MEPGPNGWHGNHAAGAVTEELRSANALVPILNQVLVVESVLVPIVRQDGVTTVLVQQVIKVLFIY